MQWKAELSKVIYIPSDSTETLLSSIAVRRAVRIRVKKEVMRNESCPLATIYGQNAEDRTIAPKCAKMRGSFDSEK